MKKWLSLILCTMVIFTLAGCGSGGSSGRTRKQPYGVRDVLEEGMAAEDNKKDSQDSPPSETVTDRNDERQNGVNEDAPEPEPINESEISAGSTDGIDIDLTELSSTMVYSEVYNMLSSPESYIGKNVKMDGSFGFYYDEASGNNYYSCIIADAAACCSQGIEFVLTDEYAYPDDYPEEGREICVVGVFDTYQEGGYTYCTLRDAKMLQRKF